MSESERSDVGAPVPPDVSGEADPASTSPDLYADEQHPALERIGRGISALGASAIMAALGGTTFDMGWVAVLVVGVVTFALTWIFGLPSVTDAKEVTRQARRIGKMDANRGVELHPDGEPIERVVAIERVSAALDFAREARAIPWGMRVALAGMTGWATWKVVDLALRYGRIPPWVFLSLPLVLLPLFVAFLGFRQNRRIQAALERQLTAVLEFDGEVIAPGDLPELLPPAS